MNRVLFLRLLLLLPFVVPAAGIVLPRLAGFSPPAAFGFLGYASLIAALPYSLLCVALLLYLREKPPSQYVRAYLWSPVLFLLPLNLSILLLVTLDPTFGLEEFPRPLFLYFSAYGVAIGYAYVVAGYLGYRAAERCGFFAPAA